MTTDSIDVAGELSESPIGSFHRWLAVILASVIVFDGYVTLNPSYVVHYAAHAWKLTTSQSGLLVSSGLVGFLIGSAVHGVVADKRGRRTTLLVAMWITSIFTLCTPIIGKSLLSFCLVRIATGVGLGVLLPLATTYMNEFAPRRYANTLPIWGVAFGWAMGAALASLAGILLTPKYGWQSLYYVGSISFVLLIFMHAYLPESAKFLAEEGRVVEVKDLLKKIRPDRASVYAQATRIETVPGTSKGAVSLLFSDRYRRKTLTIWIAALASLFCVYALSGWLPSVMLRRGESFTASFGFGAMMQIASFAGALLGGYLIDRTGAARSWMAMFWILGGLAILPLAFANTHLLNILSVIAAGFGIPGAQFLLNNYTARSYETAIRASAVGMELAVGRFGAILGPYITGVLQQIYGKPSAMFVVVSAAACLAGLAVLTLREQDYESPDMQSDRVSTASRSQSLAT
jgi:MFS family permease